MARKSTDQRAREFDARWNIPRLAEAQYASSYRAIIDFTKAVVSSFVLLFSSLFAAVCLAFTLYFALSIGIPLSYSLVGAAFFALVILAMLGVDIYSVWLPFSRLKQRESHGNARRATVQDLVGRGLGILKGAVSEVPIIIIGTFGAFHYLINNLDQFSGHSIYVGPPRSGKSASFFIPQIRQYPRFGSTLALAIKGEIYRYTANYFKRTWRIDLNNPEMSDRLPLLSACRNNANLAGELCALFVSLESPGKGGGVNDKFFSPAAVSLGKSLILHLANTIKNPTPAHIVEFIGKHPRDVEVPGPGGKTIKIDMLDFVLSQSTNETVRSNWNIFRRYDLKLQGGIIATLVTSLDQFTLPNVQVVFSAPTELDLQRGVRVVDFRKLREKGTAIYVCINEGKDAELSKVIASIFGYANNILKQTADQYALECPCVMSLDEASNIYLPFVLGGIGVGRGLGIYYQLGIQAYEYLEDKYGPVAAAAIWAGVNNRYILPATTGKAAKLASEHAGTTTGLSRTSVDANADANDSERASEHGRPLIDQQSIRELLVHTQALAIIGDCPAILFAFPPNAKETDPIQANEPHYNFEMPPSLEESTPAAPDIDQVMLARFPGANGNQNPANAHETQVEQDEFEIEEAPLMVDDENLPPTAEFDTDGVELSQRY
jgi:type IV secretory pathway TraG/TraD family ATPase VirD4